MRARTAGEVACTKIEFDASLGMQNGNPGNLAGTNVEQKGECENEVDALLGMHSVTFGSLAHSL